MISPTLVPTQAEGQAWPFGVLTVAYGAMRYQKQAIALSQSIRLFNPGLQLACVTDHLDSALLKKHFDILVPFQPDLGKGFRQKLWFDVYSPFPKTIYIDSDCFVVGSLLPLFNRANGTPFGVLGVKAVGDWWYMDVAKVNKRFGFPYLPKFNGGFFYFENTPASKAVFLKTRQVARIQHKLGVFELGDWFNDEPFYGFTLGYLGQEPIWDQDQRTGMYTPAEFTDPLTISVIDGICNFTRHGQLYNPVVVHFFGDHTTSYHYLREKWKLHLLLEKHRSRSSIAFQQSILDMAYRAFIAIYSTIAKFRGQKLPFSHPFPLVPLLNFGTSIMKKFIYKF